MKGGFPSWRLSGEGTGFVCLAHSGGKNSATGRASVQREAGLFWMWVVRAVQGAGQEGS